MNSETLRKMLEEKRDREVEDRKGDGWSDRALRNAAGYKAGADSLIPLVVSLAEALEQISEARPNMSWITLSTQRGKIARAALAALEERLRG